jgi:hypothetical protein
MLLIGIDSPAPKRESRFAGDETRERTPMRSEPNHDGDRPSGAFWEARLVRPDGPAPAESAPARNDGLVTLDQRPDERHRLYAPRAYVPKRPGTSQNVPALRTQERPLR